MDFFNKLGKKATETYQVTKEKATNLSAEIKIRGKISDYKDKIEEKYSEIGKEVYNQIKEGKDVSKDSIVSKCDEITISQGEISKLKEQLLTLKKVKKCEGCGNEIPIDSDFCPKCGKSQPKVENVEVKEEPEDVKDAEVIEINDVEKEENKEETKEENKD